MVCLLIYCSSFKHSIIYVSLRNSIQEGYHLPVRFYYNNIEYTNVNYKIGGGRWAVLLISLIYSLMSLFRTVMFVQSELIPRSKFPHGRSAGPSSEPTKLWKPAEHPRRSERERYLVLAGAEINAERPQVAVGRMDAQWASACPVRAPQDKHVYCKNSRVKC